MKIKIMLYCVTILSLLLVACESQNNPSSSSSPSRISTESTTSEPTSSVSSDSSGIPSSSSSDQNGLSYTFYAGNFKNENSKLTSTATNSIALVDNEEFEEGKLSVKVTPNSNADNGLIFAVTHPSSSNFWEGSGVSYYFFFVSRSGTAYLGKTNNGAWTVCQEKIISGFTQSSTYEITIYFDKSDDNYDLISCYVNGSYYFTYTDEIKLPGTEYGVRAGGIGAEFKDMVKSDEMVDTGIVKLGNYYVANGSYQLENDVFTSKASNSIAFRKDDVFSVGTMEATVTIGGTTADNGIIFGLTESPSNLFWEAGVSYYFYFISFTGNPFLGKVSNGSWSSLAVTGILPGYSNTNTYKLKVDRNAETILCYVDDQLYLTYNDELPLTGTSYGLRAGGNEVSYKNIVINNTGTISYETPENYDVITGEVKALNSAAMKSTKSNSLALNNEETLVNSTFKANISAATTLETGLVFKSDATASSYYKFYSSGNKMYLSKVINGTAVTLASGVLSAGYSNGGNYQYRVVVNGNNIYCYFNNILYASYTDVTMLSGDRFGILAKASGSYFTGVSKTSSVDIDKAKTLVYGHSYMELWTNSVRDLSPYYQDVVNIGIGGSIASHWFDFEDEIVAYGANTGIYMIGINDLTAGIAPGTVYSNVKQLLLNIKARIPDYEVCILSVNRCPTREHLRTQISDLNTLLRNLANEYEWIHYGDLDNAFLDNSGNVVASNFSDGLHLTASAYAVVVNAINEAFASK